MQADYAILILSYNHPDLTHRTIESVLKLQFPPENIFLMHNGSEKKFQTQLQNIFPQIGHFALDINRGFTGGANYGLQKTFENFENVFFLTNDTEVNQLPEYFPAADLISPMIYKRKTAEIDSIAGALNIQTGQLKHLRKLEDLKLSEKLYVPGTAFGIKRVLFNRLQGFDETFHTYWEDVDFSLRATQMGIQIHCSDQFQLLHKIGKTCHKDRFYTLYLFQRNRRKLMNKHHYVTFRFWISYSYDMLKLLKKIISKPNRVEPLKFWWKAIYE